jgi:tetratricopeptide (TPR) repeat protein
MKTEGRAVRPVFHRLCGPRLAALLLLCLLACGGCLERKEPAVNDLDAARAAFVKQNYLEAERAFERYLRGNPNGAERWETWNNLVQISLTIRRDRRSAIELLEAMRIEYTSDHARRREVELLLATQFRQEGKYDRAEALWDEVAGDPETEPGIRTQAYRDLADIYLHRLEFERAREALTNCLATLSVSQTRRAQCLYDMSEVYMAMDDLDPAAEQLRALLALQDIPNDLRLISIFMLADTVEQQNDPAAAKTLFESIRGEYPNRRVIEKRLEFLDKKLAGTS